MPSAKEVFQGDLEFFKKIEYLKNLIFQKKMNFSNKNEFFRQKWISTEIEFFLNS